MIEELESRRMRSVTVEDGVLTVVGTEKADVIEFGSAPSVTTGNSTLYSMRVMVNGTATDISFAQFTRIEVRAGGGDDVVRLGPIVSQVFHPIMSDVFQRTYITIPATFFGGDGDDRLVGGRGDDVLRGGRGNDTLRGHNGDDRLFGRRGVDQVFGGAGDDMTDIHSLRLSIGCESIRATGLLRNDIGAIGGDTTGWHLQLNDALIELNVSDLPDEPSLLVGKRVRVWGSFQTVNYVERGPTQVLYVTSITKLLEK